MLVPASLFLNNINFSKKSHEKNLIINPDNARGCG
jgi:hypothetical protein